MSNTGTLLSAFLLCAMLSAVPATAGAASEPAPMVAVDTPSQDFGRVAKGVTVERTFTIRNVGTASLKIESAQLSMPGMDIRVKQVIPAGESAEVRISWDTSDYVREVEGQAVLRVNDPNRPQVRLTLTGTVVAPIDILPMPAVYLSQFHGAQSARTVEIRNNQNRPLSIQKLVPTGDGFEAKLEVAEPGKVFRVTVTAAADKPIGRHHHLLVVHTDDPGRPKVPIEVNILVKPAVYVSVEQLDFGRISISQLRRNPSTLDLLADQFVVTRRAGEMSITAIGSDLPFLTFSKEPGSPSRTFTVRVGLDPDKLVAGGYQGTVTLATDDPEFPELSLPVRVTITE